MIVPSATLFLHPLVVERVWLWLAIPLCLAIAVVVKTLKCPDEKKILPRALWFFFLEILGLAGLGALLWLIIWLW